MTELNTIKTLTDAGGKMWEKGTMRRIYFGLNLVTDFIDLDVSRYNSGNINGATLRGALISHSEAYRILDGINKIYYDLGDGKFHWTSNYKNYVSEFCAMLRDLLNESGLVEA